MALEVLGQLAVGGLDGGREIVREDLDLLREASADDRVVAIRAERERLAVEGLLAHVIANQPRQLLARREPVPDPTETLCKTPDPPLGYDDFFGRAGASPAPTAEPRIEPEQHSAEHEKVQQRFLEQFRHGTPQKLTPPRAPGNWILG